MATGLTNKLVHMAAVVRLIDDHNASRRPVAKGGEERNGKLLQSILALPGSANRMALGHAYRHAPSVHHHSGSTGRKHPTSSGSQSMVDNHRFCAAAKSYWAMGFRIYALAETRQIRIRIQTKTLHRHHRGADRIGSCADQHGVESVPDYTP
jgi:hypothetical protein